MKLVWDKVGERFYETGCDHGVLYPIQTGGKYNKGVAWNGLSAVTESPSGAEPSPIYADNIKYLNMMSAEDFGGTIEAYTYPDEFAECDGSVEIAPGVFAGQQSRKQFGLSYRTILGNDVDSDDYGYKLHLVYGCLAYGVKSEDGRRFMKSEEISRSFMESPAYEILFEELVTNDKAAADFVNAVMNVGNSAATPMISTNTQN